MRRGIKIMFPRFVAAVVLALTVWRPGFSAEPARVVIVGGGLSGLVAAYELQKQGVTATILEAENRWGGRVVTMHYGEGLKAEYGMHEIWALNPLNDYIKEFNIRMSEPEQPYSSVVMDGKLYPYVQDTADEYFAAVFTPEEKAQYAAWLKECGTLYDEGEEKGLTPRLAELQKVSFAQWVETFKLLPKVSEFVRLALECEVATDWTNISAVYGIEQHGIFLHGTQLCYHSQEGNSKIIEAFVERIKGPKILGARVARIVRTKNADGRTEARVYYHKDGRMQSIKAEKVIVTVPYHFLHAIQMEPSLTEAQWQAVDSLTPGRYVVVHFVLDTEANKVLLVNGKNPFPVLTRGPLGVVYGFLELPKPAQKKETFGLLIHGDFARPYLEPQDKMRERLLAEMDKLWPGFSKYVLETYFYNYHPVATPGWPPGRSPIDTAQDSLRQENVGLFLAGDYIYSSHSEGSVISGRETAKKIAAELKAH